MVQPVLQPEQAQVGAQRHLADAVAVEVKLVLSEVCGVVGRGGKDKGQGGTAERECQEEQRQMVVAL